MNDNRNELITRAAPIWAWDIIDVHIFDFTAYLEGRAVEKAPLTALGLHKAYNAMVEASEKL